MSLRIGVVGCGTCATSTNRGAKTPPVSPTPARRGRGLSDEASGPDALRERDDGPPQQLLSLRRTRAGAPPQTSVLTAACEKLKALVPRAVERTSAEERNALIKCLRHFRPPD